MLLGAGLDVDETDSDGRTALMQVVAAARGKIAVAEALLRGGASPNAPDKRGNTPCHYARRSEMLEVLLRFGGDLRMRNDGGMTPFQFQGSPADLCPVYEAWTSNASKMESDGVWSLQ